MALRPKRSKRLFKVLGTSYRAINALEEEFKSHVGDLVDMDETRNMLTRLQGACSENDNQIKMLERLLKGHIANTVRSVLGVINNTT